MLFFFRVDYTIVYSNITVEFLEYLEPPYILAFSTRFKINNKPDRCLQSIKNWFNMRGYAFFFSK